MKSLKTKTPLAGLSTSGKREPARGNVKKMTMMTA
jgi:hypothetical protein